MGYLTKVTTANRHSVLTCILETSGDAGELEFFLRLGIEKAKELYPHINCDDPEKLRKAAKEACSRNVP